MFAEAFTRPITGIAVALHLRNAVGGEQFSELEYNVLRRERRPTLANCVKYGHIVLLVADRQRHAVGTSAARINKCRIGDSGYRWALSPPTETHASTASRFTKLSTSLRNCAPYSAAALAGSCSVASSITRCGTVGFISRVGACQTSVGSPSLP